MQIYPAQLAFVRPQRLRTTETDMQPRCGRLRGGREELSSAPLALFAYGVHRQFLTPVESGLRRFQGNGPGHVLQPVGIGLLHFFWLTPYAHVGSASKPEAVSYIPGGGCVD